ncbi:MAG: ATP-dependent helicase HrpB [Rhizobiaceae bacterium]
MKPLPELPVSAVLPALAAALGTAGSAVLVAPPGAGKTTIVPLALLDEPWAAAGRIVLIEPRRIAARAAARRMAGLIGEPPGETVGYAMRMENRSGPKTRILVVTEGVFTRMALDDPELSGVSAVLFDEFHERSLDGDFGLALALDIAGALRPDLKLLVMSATLDAAAVAGLLGEAKVVESAGRSFAVEIRHRPRKPDQMVEDAVAAAVVAALGEGRGSCLVFLPGQREIARVAERLGRRVPADVDIVPLHGGLDGRAQDAAIRPAEEGRRKVVLATAVAETSITIDGVDTVIDSGLARLPKFEPSTGLTRLETVRVSKASADQRAGRAGRTAPGVAIRLWHEGQTASLPETTRPEILEADLTGLLLDCAAFGIGDPAALRLLDRPPRAALEAARGELARLGALDRLGGITETGRAMRRLPLPVGLAHMVIEAAGRGEALAAAELAVIIGERGLGGADTDLDRRLAAFCRDGGQRAANARKLAARLAETAGGRRGGGGEISAGRLLLDAWPDRVAKARDRRGHFVLANGRGGVLDETDPLAREPWLVVADMQGKAAGARITAAACVSSADIEERLADRIETRVTTLFDRPSATVRQREQRRLGAVSLAERNLAPPTGATADIAIIGAIREYGLDLLPWDDRTRSLRKRLQWLHTSLGDPWPPAGDEALLATLESWLRPFLGGEPRLSALSPRALEHGLRSRLPGQCAGDLEAFAPAGFEAPTGSRITIDYRDDGPVVAIRVQELYGLDTHPAIAGGAVPLKLELLSPAGRPIQSTLDLPGFWRGSWADVRRDMRGRYPKHAWPETPQSAAPTTRARPRGKRN